METTLKAFTTRMINNYTAEHGHMVETYTSNVGVPVIRININRVDMEDQLFDYIRTSDIHIFNTADGLEVVVGQWVDDEAFIIINRP